MECNKFVDEKIGETHTAEFRDHLAGCAGCGRDLEELREVRTLYREAASAEKYRGGVPRVRRFRTGWIPMAAAAAVLLMVFGLILKPADRIPPKVDSDNPPIVFFRVHLEPWGGDTRYGNAFDDAWRKLEQLEKR